MKNFQSLKKRLDSRLHQKSFSTHSIVEANGLQLIIDGIIIQIREYLEDGIADMRSRSGIKNKLKRQMRSAINTARQIISKKDLTNFDFLVNVDERIKFVDHMIKVSRESVSRRKEAA